MSSTTEETATITLENTMKSVENGKFQTILLIACLAAFAVTVVVPTVMRNYMLTIVNDFGLDWDDLIVLNQILYACILIGTFSWSLISDLLSRKLVLVIVLMTNVIFTVLLAKTDKYFSFVLCRGIVCFTASGIAVVVTTYLAEYDTANSRGVLVCALQLSWFVVTLVFPELPLNWNYQVLLAAALGIVALGLLIYLPDSPRFLMSQGKKAEAITSVRRMFYVTTGKNITNLSLRGMYDNNSLSELEKSSVFDQPEPSRDANKKFWWVAVLVLSQFVSMFSYNTKSIWFSELPRIGEAYFPIFDVVQSQSTDCRLWFMNEKNQSAYISVREPEDVDNATEEEPKRMMFKEKKLTGDLQLFRELKEIQKDTGRMLASTFSLVAIYVLVNYVDKVPKKYFACGSNLLFGILIFSMFFMGATFKWFASCATESLTLISLAVAQCMAVDLFPTKLRNLGVAIIIGAGHFGSIVANTGFILSLNVSCVGIAGCISICLLMTGLLHLSISV